MNIEHKGTSQYIAPFVELIDLPQGQSLLSTMSIYGDVSDYEPGGEYEGDYADPII